MAGTAAAARTIRQWGYDALPNITAGVVVLASHLLLFWLVVDMSAAPRGIPTPEQVRMRLTLLPPAAPTMPIATEDAAQPTPERAAPPPRQQPAPALPAQRPSLRPLPAPPPAPLAAFDPSTQQEEGRQAPAPLADTDTDTDAAVATPSAAPSTPPTPAPHAAGNSDPNWEGRVLARLQRFRDYPRPARHQRQEGVVYVRARLDRQGRVLSASIRHSSGHAALDQAALSTFQRAQPLPRSPETVPDPVDVDIPVEFFLH
jgi:protein TonB